MIKAILRWSVLWVIFWTAVALVSVLPQLGQSVHEKDLLLALAEWWSWGILVPGIVALDHALPFSAQLIVARVISHLFLGPLLGVVYCYIRAALNAMLGVGTWSRLTGTAVIFGAIRDMFWTMLVYCLIVGVWEAYSYRRRYASAELQMERMQRNFSEARLNALRMQLDPHFLFNALNTVSSQVEREPKLARKMIEHLGDLLRLSLNSHGVHEISLAEELAFLDHYLAIQIIRFGDTLKVEKRIDPCMMNALVPSLFIQPLVENAIRHGISKRARGGLIVLSAQEVDERLVIQVLDDGVGLPSGWSFEEHKGVGLSVTRERFAGLHPGNSSQFELRRRNEGGTEVTISFPLRRRKEADRGATT